jgi:DNA invertase Pin-like site-specific DNA recombinase
MRVCLYARYSSDRQNPRSVDDQVRELRDFCDRRGWIVVDTFSDPEVSGATVILRPGVQAMMAAAAEGRFDVVLVESLDRFSRDLGDTANLRKSLKFHQVALHTLSGEQSLLHIAFDGARAEQFLEDLKVKVRRGQRGNISRGLAAGGVSYGYEVVREFDDKGRVQGGRRRINEAEAAIVREVLTSYAAGVSPLAIAEDLNRRGIPAPRGGRWRASTISGNKARRTGILQNELYTGQLTYGRTCKAKNPATGKELIRNQPEAEWKRQYVPELRIIDDATWAEVRAMMTRTGAQARAGKPVKRAAHLLSGLITCTCGAPYVARDAKRLSCRGFMHDGTCTNARRVRRDWIETRVLDEIAAALARPEAVAAHAHRLHQAKAAQDGQRRGQHRAAVKELGEVRTKIGRLVNSIADGDSAPASIMTMITSLEAREKVLAATVDSLKDEDVVRLEPNAHRLYAARLANLREALESGTPAQRAKARSLLRGLIERVEIIPVTGADGRETFEWKLVGKLAEFLKLAANGGAEKTPNVAWGSVLVRVEEVGQIPPPLLELRFTG